MNRRLLDALWTLCAWYMLALCSLYDRVICAFANDTNEDDS